MNVYPGFISTKRDLDVKMTFSDLSLCTEMKLESSLLLHYATKSTCVNGTCESLVSTVDDSRWFSEETISENKKKKNKWMVFIIDEQAQWVPTGEKKKKKNSCAFT